MTRDADPAFPSEPRTSPGNFEPRCVRCGRGLRDARSIAIGAGPTCAAVLGRSSTSLPLFDDQPVLNGCGPLEDVGLVCVRLEDGRLACNVPHVVTYHSPTGFECGYGGSGPAELALNVLHLLLPPFAEDGGFRQRWRPVNGAGTTAVSDAAFSLHQDFKRAFIESMPAGGGRVPIEVIREWIDERRAEAAS